MKKLNPEQSKHLAGTFRILSIGVFGLYGYPFISSKGGSFTLFLLAVIASILIEVITLFILSEGNQDE